MAEKAKKDVPETKSFTIDEASDGIRGKITLNEDVVATIAGLAAREIPGIYSLGKSRMISFGDSPTRGVEAEVGNKQAAFDLDVVIEYGCDIRKVASSLRSRIADEVNRMAGREVVEINLNVVDIKLPEAEKPKKEPEKPRVM